MWRLSYPLALPVGLGYAHGRDHHARRLTHGLGWRRGCELGRRACALSRERPYGRCLAVLLPLPHQDRSLGRAGSIGRVGTAYDNALIESTIGLYKTELIDRRGIGWGSRRELEAATARWVAWFNRDRLHGELGYRPPIELEMAYVQKQGQLRPAA